MYWLDNFIYVIGEYCEMYVKYFEGLFGIDVLVEMVVVS